VPDASACIAEGDFSTQSGARAVRAWAAAPNLPTAIIGVNDSVALGALSALNELHLRVPDDIALAGFDGVQATSVSLVGLTTVDQHIDELGRAAVRILIGQLNNPEFTPVRRVLPPELLLRRSTNGAGQTALPGFQVYGRSLVFCGVSVHSAQSAFR
jgi:LacI family transcriptional regulator